MLLLRLLLLLSIILEELSELGLLLLQRLQIRLSMSLRLRLSSCLWCHLSLSICVSTLEEGSCILGISVLTELRSC